MTVIDDVLLFIAICSSDDVLFENQMPVHSKSNQSILDCRISFCYVEMIRLWEKKRRFCLSNENKQR